MNDITKTDNNNYDSSKYNAVKHGVLSREAVLSWESKDDYESLLMAFESDYEPEGVTETYLVTELAQVVWRKRRLRMAEKTITKANLMNCDSYSNTTIKKAIYAHPDIKRLEKGTVEEAFRMSDKEAKEKIKFLQKTIRSFEKLLAQDLTYDGYMEAIDDDLKSNWKDWLEEPQYQASVDSFRRFLKYQCIDYYKEQLDPLLVRDAIKEEALCESAEPTERFINLARYETTLDRKFEKTLAMLIKLQDLRGKEGRVK
jgi:hypothetical protein